MYDWSGDEVSVMERLAQIREEGYHGPTLDARPIVSRYSSWVE
jgi:hypothetical protein